MSIYEYKKVERYMEGHIADQRTGEIKTVPGCVMRKQDGQSVWVSGEALRQSFIEATTGKSKVNKKGSSYITVITALVACWTEAGCSQREGEHDMSVIDIIVKRGFAP